jgi:dCTP diphosphatase
VTRDGVLQSFSAQALSSGARGDGPADGLAFPYYPRCYDPNVLDETVRDALRQFIAERDWDKFHSPANLAKSISIEAGELLECFQWDDAGAQDEVAAELADVLTYCLLLADKLGVDPKRIVLEKLDVTRTKYPSDRSHGRTTKYDQL